MHHKRLFAPEENTTVTGTASWDPALQTHQVLNTAKERKPKGILLCTVGYDTNNYFSSTCYKQFCIFPDPGVSDLNPAVCKWKYKWI